MGRHGESCSVRCKEPLVALGIFNCTFGDYGSIPRCKNPYDSFIRTPYVKGTLRGRLSVGPPPTPAPMPTDVTGVTTSSQAPLVVPTDNPRGPNLYTRAQAAMP